MNSKERLTQIRLAEAFQIHGLDLQARLHYAPRDSRVHIAEKVMKSLNKHAGAGHTIPIPSVPLTNLVSTGEILTVNQDLPASLVGQTGWYEYDGLWEHRKRGTGLKFCGKEPLLPLDTACPMHSTFVSRSVVCLSFFQYMLIAEGMASVSGQFIYLFITSSMLKRSINALRKNK